MTVQQNVTNRTVDHFDGAMGHCDGKVEYYGETEDHNDGTLGIMMGDWSMVMSKGPL